METGIGATLRDARNRHKVDLSEVEAATKIRARYLRAIENEEWDLLPGDAYARGFVRTYAGYLGLDGDRLADEYRRSTGPATGERVPRRVEPVVSGAPGHRGPRLPGRALAVLVSLALVGVLVALGLTGGDDGGPQTPSPAAKQAADDGEVVNGQQAVTARPGVALSLGATGEVWVCLLDSDEEPLIDGVILEPGAEAGPFRDAGFSLALGNGEAELTIDGEPAETPPSASPVGYEIDAGGDLTALEEGERPDCE